MSDLDDLADALRSWANGPDWRAGARCGPLSARGETNEAEYWEGRPALKARRRAGHPMITVHSNRTDWVASVIASPHGRHTIVVVPRGTEIVEVDQ